MRGTIYISAGLLIAGAVSGEVFIDVPTGLDHNAVKAALSDHGIQGFDPMSPPTRNGLYLANAGSVGQMQQQQQMQQNPQSKQGQQAPAPMSLSQQSASQMSSPQPSSAAKQAAIPLVPGRGPNVGLQQQQQQQSEEEHLLMTSTVVLQSTTTIPISAVVPATEGVGLAREKPPMTASIASAPQPPSRQLPAVAGAAPAAQAQPAAAADDEEEVVEEEEVEEEATAPNPARPAMVVRASASAFKPTDIDKFTFPSSELSVNMAGPGKESASKSGDSKNSEGGSKNVGFHASMPTASPDHPSAASPKSVSGKQASASNSEQSARGSAMSSSSAKGPSFRKASASQSDNAEKDSGAAGLSASSAAAAIAVAVAAIGGALI
ncbi:hypothetical protein LPJ72_003655 [Coemansia sp. Benny D160-2]|nr:hypothetical protein LPJ72_003655 [Coemansia sp. Benny D160-2]